MDFTREQLLAQSTNKHLAVVANAGSGKTAVLVNRYLSLLLNGVDVREIIAITFTKKAAAEMQKRVAEKLEAILADSEQRARWNETKRIRERLNSARISTIHSFCARLLRDFPIEADVNPNFSELSEYEGFVLKRDATIYVLEERLVDDGERRSETLQLLRVFGRSTVEQYMEELLAGAESFREIQNLYQRDTRDLTERVRRVFSAAVQQRAARAAEALRAVLSTASPEAFARNKPAREQFAQAQSAFGIMEEAIVRLSSSSNWQDLEHLIMLCSTVQECLCTQSGTLRAPIAKSIDNPVLLSDLNAQLSSAFQALDGLQEVCGNHELDTTLTEYARLLCTMAHEAQQWVEKEKARLGALDFDDLQLKASTLLDNRNVVERFGRRFRYLMVDEFQDTNELQYAIARKLVAAIRTADTPEWLAEALPETSINFFIVGDPKQSIYGFRGADVRVFEKARRHIAAVNERTAVPYLGDTSATEEEYYGNVRLSASFRLLPTVAAFVNRVCSLAMNTRESEFDVAYEPLVCGRQSNDPNPHNGSITLLVAQKRRKDNTTGTEDDTESEEGASEAEMLARHISKIVVSETPISVWERSRGEEQPRPARWGDIAILARSRTGFETLAAALRKRNIPFVIHSGTGYFDKQEILDMRSFLLFLSNPSDDIALAAILRSPFFGITDTELFNIGTSGGGSLWERLAAYRSAYADSSCSLALLRAYRILSELLPLAPRLAIPSLLRTILSLTTWRAVIAAEERRDQMEANMEKLLSLAREFEEKGFRNLFDFAEELYHLARHSDSEGEAEVTVGKDAVQIMTVHASKGLEFPIVALYQSSTVNNRAASFYADPAFGACFRLPVDTDDGIPGFAETPLYWLARQQARAREHAERKRVLYVALTRAENHLIITGTVTVTAKGDVGGVDGFFRAVVDALEVPYSDVRTNHSVHLHDSLTLLCNGEPREHALHYTVDIVASIAEPDILHTIASSQEIAVPMLLLDTVPYVIEGDMYSASQLQLFISDPYEYELLYRLGLPPSEDHVDYDRARVLPDDTTDMSSTTPGTIIHAVLASLPLWYANGTVNEQVLHDTVERKLREYDVPLTHPVTARIHRETRAVATSAFLARYSHAFVDARFEYPFHMQIERDYLIGSVDALVPSPDGDIELWDWKTNAIASSFDMFRLFDRYRLQLEIYAYFLAKFRPQQQRITARLLFTRLAEKASNDAGWMQTLTVERSELERIEMKIMSIIGEIRHLSYGEVR